MNSVYYKEHGDGSGSNPVGSLSSGSGPWWSGLVTQTSFERVKPSSMQNQASSGEQLAPIAPNPSAQVGEKRNITHFNIFPGGSKSSSNGQKPVQLQSAFTMQSSPAEYGGHVELGFRQPAMIYGKYPNGDQYYGLLSTYGPQIAGRIMLPLSLSTDDRPIFVNAKQYHGIIRRRRSRAKAEMANKVVKTRKPYLHLSRHLHAMRRPRGCGGRFLNTKETGKGGGGGNLREEDGRFLFCDPSGSQTNSEVMPQDTSPEVTSMFSMGDLNCFPLSLSEMMMHGKWAAAGAGSNVAV